MSKARKLVDLAVYYCMLVSWALLLHILYAVCCRLFYAMETAIFCQGHCCFIYCMLCTATCVVPRVATLALCQGDCCLIYVLYTMYILPQTLLFVSRTLLPHILYAVYQCMFVPWPLVLHMYIASCILPHVFAVDTAASYVYCRLCTAAFFVPLPLLHTVYFVCSVL